jgi:hypothetical protein
MKAALKWLGYAALALVAFALFANADKTGQVGVVVALTLGYMIYNVATQIADMHKDMTNRLERLYDKLEHASHKIHSLDNEVSRLRRSLDAGLPG